MKAIYQLKIGDVEGRTFQSGGFFEDEQDAYKAGHLNEFGKGEGMNTNYVEEVTLWEKGEYSPERIKIQKALAKLTDEEKRLLGLS